MSFSYRDHDHPEKRVGEICIGYAPGWAPLYVDGEGHRDFVRWKTVRYGDRAWDVFGLPQTGVVPIFVARSEFEGAGGVVAPSVDQVIAEFPAEAVSEAAKRMVDGAEYEPVLMHLMDVKTYREDIDRLKVEGNYVAIVRAASRVGMLTEGETVLSV